MKKGWWIVLSTFLFLLNIFLAMEVKQLKKYPFHAEIPLEGPNRQISPENEQSFLTLIIYFSERSCKSCMEESYYWNKLFLDLKKQEIFILGIIPEKEDLKKAIETNKILFPVLKDKGNRFAEKFNISNTPFKIILDRQENCLYMSSSVSRKESQENFYFEVLEHLRNIQIKEYMKRKSSERSGVSFPLQPSWGGIDQDIKCCQGRLEDVWMSGEAVLAP